MFLQNYISYVTRTYLFIAMMGLQIAVFLDLFLVLRDPFSPRERRLNYFYLIPISLLTYIWLSNEKDMVENKRVRINMIYITTAVTIFLMMLII